MKLEKSLQDLENAYNEMYLVNQENPPIVELRKKITDILFKRLSEEDFFRMFSSIGSSIDTRGCQIIIPYQLNAYTIGGCFPVKFHEALAAGLPTIVTDLPAYYPFRDVCYIAKDHSQFSEFVGKAIKDDSQEKIRARMEVASKNNWEGKVDQLLNILSSYNRG